MNTNNNARFTGAILSGSLICLASWGQTQAAELLAWWDFNDASNPAVTVDKIYASQGALENGAAFTPAGDGRTSAGTDRGMDFGPDSAQQLVRISEVPFLNAAAANDQITISFWQKLYDVAASSAFWGVSPSSNNGERGIQAHVTWSDNNIYFDTAGCCDAGTQRINRNLLDWDPSLDLTAWHHFAFVKNGPVKQVWVDGRLFHEGSNTAPLPKDFTRLMLGADNAGGNSMHGVEDDFAVYAGALDAGAIGALAQGTAPDKVPGVVVPTEPLVGGAIGNPTGFTVKIYDSPTATVDKAMVQAQLDGKSVVAQVDKVGSTTTVNYSDPATLLPASSSHEVVLTFKDTQNVSYTETRGFTVAAYAIIPPEAKVTADTSKPGFLWNVHQNDALQSNDNQRPEDQLAGRLIDAASGEPYANLADNTFPGVASAAAAPADPAWAPLKFEIPTVINLSQVEGENNGNFTPDQAMPGIASDLQGIAAEIIAYIDLPAGVTRMGVNSDDGFRTKSGQPLDAFRSITLGEFNGGRGAADTLFDFYVQEAGVYAFRTVWEEGGGGANVEWFTVKADGSKVLVNDRANGGLPAYRATTTGLKPYVSSAKPGPAPRQLNLVSSVVELELVDGTSENVNDNSVVLKLDGKTVNLTKKRAGNVLTVTYAPDGLQIPSEQHTGELSFAGTAGTTRTDSWPFRNLKSIILPAPKILETFDSYPEDSQPPGWTAWNFTARCQDGRDITSQTSESYEDWVLTDVANIGLIDGGRPFNITPGQMLQIGGNAVELKNADPPGGVFPEWIMSGNVLYAESDSRCNADFRGATEYPNNGQTQFITSKPFDLSAFKGVVMTFSSIYEQNQDSLGAVEYSVDGGNNWLPVMYFLEEPDIKLNGDGTVDAARTFNDPNADTSSWVVNGVTKGDKYGDGLAAPITAALGPYVVPRVNDGQVEGKRVEVARLAGAKGKSDVRIRLAALGTDSWYFAIDNLAFYDVEDTTQPPPGSLSISLAGANVTLSWTGGGTLQEATAITGDWTSSGNQSNPQTVAAGGAAKYFRLAQ